MRELSETEHLVLHKYVRRYIYLHKICTKQKYTKRIFTQKNENSLKLPQRIVKVECFVYKNVGSVEMSQQETSFDKQNTKQFVYISKFTKCTSVLKYVVYYFLFIL